MAPAARVAAAISVLDHVLSGTPAEQALTRWARASRFAGSKDRNAVRDHVFGALRCMRSFAALGGAAWPDTTGRAVTLGALRSQSIDPTTIFTGQGYAPPALTEAESTGSPAVDENAEWNLPDWLIDEFKASLGEDAKAAARALAERAPVTIRVNTRKSTVGQVQSELQNDGIETQANPLSPTALKITHGARGLVRTSAFHDGLFELQDVSSQAVVDVLSVKNGVQALDFCAGGGGKTLALAAATGAEVTAHDAEPGRMADLPNRAARAGAQVRVVKDLAQLKGETFDLVLVDAPCSGSGSWRRAPDAKWRLTPNRLQTLQDTQKEILQTVQSFVGQSGCLAYATCSVLRSENDAQVDAFLAANPEWRAAERHRWPISTDGDGFYLAQLYRE